MQYINKHGTKHDVTELERAVVDASNKLEQAVTELNESEQAQEEEQVYREKVRVIHDLVSPYRDDFEMDLT